MSPLFKYYFAFFAALNFKRITNLAKIKLSYWFSTIVKKDYHRGMPVSISIEPTTSCNLQCPECPSGLRKFTRPTGMLNNKVMDEVMKQFSDYLMYVTFYFQGEPLLNKKFSDYVKILKNKKIVVATSTNAHYLNAENSLALIDSGLDRLIISLDGADAQTYSEYRKGGDFDLVTKNISEFIAMRERLGENHPMVELQFIVFRHNQHQVERIKQLAFDLRVDKLTLKTAQVYEYEEGNKFIPTDEKFSRYKEIGQGKFQIKSDLPNRCYRMWQGNVITWDGQVVPCCFDKDAEHKFGSIMESNYKEIVKSLAYNNFRQQILTNRKEIEICRNCSEGIKK